MGDFTRVKSPMKIHGRFYLSKKTPDYKMTHQLFTLFWIISNILTFHFYTFSVIYTFYFYIAFEELTFYQKCSIKCVLYSLFYISTIVWPRNMIRNILIATIYLFDWKLSCIMSLYQIRARQGPHIKTYLISWQLFGPKISLEIHCWPITTFFKTVGENFSQCQIVLFCMMVSNCPILHDGVKLS